MTKGKVRVVELFAGVGGFRIGLERASDRFQTVWSNQWEPNRKRQEASEIYRARFGEEGHSNADVASIEAKHVPDHDLLVGGFPCQDYSVARTLKQADGLAGKKGVLWWEIHRILEAKRPGMILLENVDRLLKSPAKQRGRDFAVMLASLADLGYAVEWRVVNAADYGMPQRRSRVFFLGYHKSSPLGKELRKKTGRNGWLLERGVLATAFPALPGKKGMAQFNLEGDLAELTDGFNKEADDHLFHGAGIMVEREVRTMAMVAHYEGARTTLGDILLPDKEVPAEYFIPAGQVKEWTYLKGRKAEKRTNKATGFAYNYKEGAMAFPDPLEKPGRTIVTGEGGSTPSRFKHVVRTDKGLLRRLTPVELERLNMFPDGHTSGATDVRRAFLMGNALVTGVVERVAEVLIGHLD